MTPKTPQASGRSSADGGLVSKSTTYALSLSTRIVVDSVTPAYNFDCPGQFMGAVKDPRTFSIPPEINHLHHAQEEMSRAEPPGSLGLKSDSPERYCRKCFP